MKLKFDVVLKDRRANDLSDQGRKVTLGEVCCAVLDAALPGDTGKDKSRAWELMRKITEHERERLPFDMLDSDIDWIKERMGKLPYTATIHGATIDALKDAGTESAGPRLAVQNVPG